MTDLDLKEETVLPLAPTPPPPPPVHRLHESEFLLDESFSYGRAAVTLPLGVPFEDVLRPEFWTQVAYMLQSNAMTGRHERSGTIVTVHTIDRAFTGEVYVRAVGEASVIVGVYKEPVYWGMQRINSRRYEVRWNIGKKGFDVIRKSDRAIVAGADKFPIREQAEAWIEELEDQRAA